MRIVHLPQLGGSRAEPLAARFTADLMAAGHLRSAVYSWEDQAVMAVEQHEGGGPEFVIGVIAFRVQKWNSAAFVSIGGVDPAFRRRGVYRGLFAFLVQRLIEHEPAVFHIDSGHHADNHASAMMHEALGRRLDGFSYTFPVRPRP